MNITIRPEYLNMPRAALLRAIRAETGLNIRTLLAAPLANPKLAKNLKLRVLSFPLHLAPARLGAPDNRPRATVCPGATPGCVAACLHTAGNPAYMKGKASARRARTLLFWARKDLYFALLILEIRAGAAKARRRRMKGRRAAGPPWCSSARSSGGGRASSHRSDRSRSTTCRFRSGWCRR